MTNTSPLSVELFVATGCVHCPVVLNELSEQLKKGAIASMQVTNIAVDNEKAAKLNIRSVPWFAIRNNQSFMIFSGAHSPKEIQQWVKAAQSNQGMQEYVEDALQNGQLNTLIQVIEIEPTSFSAIIDMLQNEDTSMETRIGLDALVEHFTSSEILKNNVSRFKDTAQSGNLRLQIDALHYIALAGNKEDREFINGFSQSEDSQLKEAAEEALEVLDDLTG